MSQVFLIPLLLTLLFFGAGAASAENPEGANTAGLAIYQHSRLVGPVAVVAGRSGLRCRLSSSKLTFILPPGGDRVFVFSSDSRKIFSTPLKGGNLPFFRGIISSTGCDFSDFEMVPSRSKEVAGRMTRAFKTSSHWEQKLVDRINNAVMGSRSAVGLHTCYFQDLKPAVDPRCGEFIAHLVGLPPSRGYPARVAVIKPDGSVFNYLETSAIRPVQLSPREFELPRGYAQAKSAAEVTGEAVNGDALHWIK